MNYSRRDFGKIAMAAVPAVAALSVPALSVPAEAAAPNSKITGVQIGVISYSFRQGVPKADLPRVIAGLGINSVELMSGDAEALAGAPAATDKAALAAWRAAATPTTFEAVRKKFDDVGVELQILCYNMGVAITDDEIDYAFRMARATGVRGISSSSTISTAKRASVFAAKHKLLWAGHGHNNITDPEQLSNEDSFDKMLAFNDYMRANLDLGHFNQTGEDPVAFMQRHSDRILNIHLKDSTAPKVFGTVSNTLTVWGDGNAPIRQALIMMRRERWPFLANIEFEYAIPAGSDAVTEVGKCLDFVKNCLAT